MNLSDWFPALTTTTLFGFAVWATRQLISTRLTRSVEHEFNRKLEQLRSDLSAAEERLKGKLREREAEIVALRSGALSSLASRQAAVDKRRLEAVDQLWDAFNALLPARGIAAVLSGIKFEAAAEQTQKSAKFRQAFQTLGGAFDESKIDLASAGKARPFVSPMAWAMFAAYRAVTMHSVMRWHVLKSGIGAIDVMDEKSIKQLVIAALPHYKDYLEEHGSSVYYYALEGLEAGLLTELQAMLNGNEFDRATLDQAAEIIRQANAIQASTNAIEHSK